MGGTSCTTGGKVRQHPMEVKYQLVILGQEGSSYKEPLVTELKKRFSDIGLDFNEHLEILDSSKNLSKWEGFPVAVWFGGIGLADPTETKIVEDLLDRGFSVFPVVESLTNYQSHVPSVLHPINGQEFDLLRLSMEIMRGFRLVRPLRQVFISYKRTESSGVAKQIFHALTERGYRVFLDTISVDNGADFQQALWSRMADVDLLILLDSPTALDSDWVYQELSRASDLGMGGVQLIWPNHTRTAGTEFSSPIMLADIDFVEGKATSDAIITDSMLKQVSIRIETERIKSMNARRIRLIDGLQASISAKGVNLVVHPTRQVDVMKGAKKFAELLPFVGVPDSFAVYEHEIAYPNPETYLIYNGLGVDEHWEAHLKWINKKTNIEICQLDDLGILIDKLK